MQITKAHLIYSFSLLAIVAAVQGALADEAAVSRLEPVNVQGARGSDPESAGYQAPTGTSLDATQPQSIMSQHWIEENAQAGANYSDIISISPSVVDVAPNGPGLMESASGGGTPTIRGFQDGQYNVTFDGIPWGDSNDFTHHSTVYFMPQDIGHIVVDRGPGDASSIGNATYGGTIAISSKDPSAVQSSTLLGSYGSWRTRLAGVQYDSGTNNDTRFYASLKDLNSDGFLSNSSQSRNNAFLKYEKAFGDNTTVSLVAMYNHNLQHVPNGATPAQQQQYGYNFGLVNDPLSEANAGINYDDLTTDFEYIGFRTARDGWTVDNKVYTYAYYHDGFYGYNTGSVSAQDTLNDNAAINGNPPGNPPIIPGTNVPGLKMHNNYRSVGDLLRASYETGAGVLETGLWFDRQTDSRFQQDVNWTLYGAPMNAESNGGSVQRDQMNTLNTAQGYVQFVWNVTPAWTVTPGIKYDSFTRTMNAAVNQKTEVPFNGQHTWDKTLKSIDTHYSVNSNWAAYAQYSEGFLAPNLNVFYRTAPDLNSVQPTTTKNYQIGTNWNSKDFNAGFDVYRVEATNVASQTACPVGYTGCFSLVGGTNYSGAELEATYVLEKGLALYGNVARNDYTTSDGSVIQFLAKNNAALGLIYQQGPIYSSLIGKYVGPSYSNVDASGNPLRFGGYVISNFTLSYKFAGDTKLGFQVYNLFNRTGDMASSFSNAAGAPLYYVIPERSYEVSFSVPF